MINIKKDVWSFLSDNTHIDIDTMPIDELNKSFESLNSKMLIIYHFVLKYNEYLNTRHYYTAEYALTTLEAHLLTDICDYPDSTVTSLACSWNRSVSATSQTIRKLIQEDLIIRENSKDDAKVFYLRPTDKGALISDEHKRNDILDTIKTIKCLKHTLTNDEIKTMFKGLSVFNELLKRMNFKWHLAYTTTYIGLLKIKKIFRQGVRKNACMNATVFNSPA